MIKRLFCFFLIFFFLISNSFAKENFILNWDKLIPLNAYDFVPETGITFEMWDDKNFVKKLNEAGLKFNKKIIGKSIKLYGFMVPLEMDYHEDLIVNEFILVPSAGMCIHVPPPPPNQMIFVKMAQSIPLDMDYRGISITGKLVIAKSKNGVYGYKLAGVSAKEANIEYDDPLLEYMEISY